MRIVIDADACQGHATCHDVAPSLIQLDDEGRGSVVAGPVPADAMGDATRAVHSCPERAISLEP